MQHVHLKGNQIQCDNCGNRSPLPTKTAKEVLSWMNTYEEKHSQCVPAKYYTVTRFNIEPLIAAAFDAYDHKKRTGLSSTWERYLDKAFGPIPLEK